MPNDHDDIERRAQLIPPIFEHARIKDALRRIRIQHKLGLMGKLPRAVTLIGETRSGKTTIVEILKNELTAGITGPRPHPVVSIPLTKGIDPHGVLVKYLADCKILHVKGRIDTLMNWIADAKEDLGIELAIIDEAQHIMPKQDEENERRADVVKSLIDQAKVPVLLVGTPDIEMLIKSNRQLHERIKDRIPLTGFDANDPKDWEDYLTFLWKYERVLPFPERCFLTRREVALAIHGATTGHPGRIVRIVEAAGNRAIDDGTNRIEAHHYAEAWDNLDHPYKSGGNPFRGLKLPPPEPKLLPDAA